MRRNLIFGICVLAMLSTCIRNEPKLVSVQTTKLTWEKRTAHASNCGQDSTSCAEFSASYPFFTGTGSLPSLLNAVTDSFATSLVALDDSSNVYTPEAAAEQLLRNFEKFRHEFPGATHGWSVHVESDVMYQSEKHITIDLMGDNYLGGAHPNTTRVIRTYEIATGKALEKQDLIKDNIKLSKLLESKYKTEKGMTDADDLKELTFDGSPLPLPANIALTEEGLIFFYNDYEVAPHAVGPTEIKLTWAEMGDAATMPNH